MNNFISLLLYFFISFLSYFFFVLAKQERKKSSKNPMVYVELLIAIVIPSIFAGLRYEVGTDFANYSYNMNSIRDSAFAEVLQLDNIELGYALGIKVLTYFFSNAQIFGIISAITLAIIIYTLLTQYGDMDTGMMYFIYLMQYYFFSYNLVRQNLALVIVFYSMKYIYDDKLKKFLFYILVAACFHYSALIFIPAYFLWNKPKRFKIKTGGKVLIIGTALLLTMNFRQVLMFLINLGIPFINKYLYLMIDTTTAQNRDIFVKILILIIFLIVRKNLRKDNEVNTFLIDLYAISVIIGFTGFYTPFFKRVAFYYAIPEIVLMSRVPKIMATPMQRYVFRWIIMIAYLLLFVLSAYILKQSHLIPYQTIFDAV